MSTSIQHGFPLILLLLLVLIAAAICSLIFLYAWVSVSVHGGGEMMPLTHGVTRPPWHLSHCSPSLSWSQNNTSSHLHVPVPVSTDHRFTQDLFEAFILLDFFCGGSETCLSSWGGGVRCPRWPGEPTALSGVFPLLPGSHLIGIPTGDPAAFGCPLSLPCCPPSHTSIAGLVTGISSFSQSTFPGVHTWTRFYGFFL